MNRMAQILFYLGYFERFGCFDYCRVYELEKSVQFDTLAEKFSLLRRRNEAVCI
ncbi:hypothetical protein MADA3029_540045 [Vibrio nigripulchritudo MADA3029]|nr:hypothetical protein VIBNIMADA3020_890047 [Vibrio nigripulchritudo MADA3020]CCN53319.1 hypothetical protein VIBNIMADA3021_290045 [Vibrio nigripulchritudo MADA3021]CCN60192.1 hypothetical protein MADA3029_540045 [Vibrio nigripulchritudo MADA3029]